ncbi:hypothetical protein GH714_020721 [Hevea brasiliensis]|uniref:Magnesium transporter n=1 Tax=Hevea brasiliensis TaxID=3981 RepID=A0A6A6MNN7_HEVBR|nr:hypothetical protein GH714_020721 [Hevea brasiliensis]
MARDGYVVPADPQVVAAAAVKKKTQPARSWILINASGQGTILDADKHAIMHRVQIHARDLRILDPLLSYPSTILGRERAIVLNLEHIKAIITSEEVGGFLSLSVWEMYCFEIRWMKMSSQLLRNFKGDYLPNLILQGQGDGKEYPSGQNDIEAGEEDESPFEFRALEVALEAICSFLAARTTELETAAYPALDELTSKISSRNLDRVRKLKSAMTRLTARVQKVRDELEQLLDDDDDMADLYLSRKLAGASPVSGSGGAYWFSASPTIGSKISRASRASVATVRGDENDVEDLEMLLEVIKSYFMQIDSTLNKLNTLREYIDDTEDYINIQLDNHRNQLIQLELFLSSGTVCLSIYSLVAGIFGMNIPYTWNDNHGYMFKWVVIITGAFSAALFILIMSYARYKDVGHLLPARHVGRRKEISLSSLVVSTPKAAAKSVLPRKRLKCIARKSPDVRESILAEELLVKKVDDCYESLSSPETISQIAQAKRQNSNPEPSQQCKTNKDTEDSAEPCEGKTELCKPLNCLVETASKSKPNKSDIKEATVQMQLPGPAENEAQVLKAMVKKHRKKSKVIGYENKFSVSPAGSVKTKKLQGVRKNRAVVSEGLNIPHKLLLMQALACRILSRDILTNDCREEDALLPQISSCYLRVKDGNLPVSSIKKYLVQKLGLASEAEQLLEILAGRNFTKWPAGAFYVAVASFGRQVVADGTNSRKNTDKRWQLSERVCDGSVIWWEPPPEKWFKLNVDGAFSSVTKMATGGGVFAIPMANGQLGFG